MLQINEKITVLYPGDQLPVVTNDAIKVYLGGTMDFGSSENDWQTKFVEGLTKLTDPLKGLLMIKGANWIIFNPHIPPTNRLAPTLERDRFGVMRKKAKANAITLEMLSGEELETYKSEAGR